MKITKIPSSIDTTKIFKSEVGVSVKCENCRITFETELVELAKNAKYKAYLLDESWFYYNENENEYYECDCLTDELKKDISLLQKRFKQGFMCFSSDAKEKQLYIKCPYCGEIIEGPSHFMIESWVGALGKVYYGGPYYAELWSKIYYIPETNEEFTFFIGVGYANPYDITDTDKLDTNKLYITASDKKWLRQLGFAETNDSNDRFTYDLILDVE